MVAVAARVPGISGSAASLFLRGENLLAGAALLAMGVLPVAEMLLRGAFGIGIPGASAYVQNLTLWVGFLGALLAAREGRHISISTLPLGRLMPVAALGRDGAAVAVTGALAYASWRFVEMETESATRIGDWLPEWIVAAILPLAFAGIALRLVLAWGSWPERALVALGLPLAAAIGFLLEAAAPVLLWPGLAGLLAAALLGAPVFVVIGGAALLLFFAAGVPVAAIPVETYRIIVSPTIPTIPLFTLAGYLLAEGGASRRLVRLSRALLGWMPGGTALAATVVCAFFATFTGASGVAIVALGGLLFPVLTGSGYPQRFSMGLITATGSIGLLFPPSLAVILYGVVAHVPIPDLFLAGVLPGLLMVVAVAALGIATGLRHKVPRPAFDARQAWAAIAEAKWELGLPLIVVVGVFGGYATLIETAAATVVYVLAVGALVHRDLDLRIAMPQALQKCLTLIGGVFIILGVAMGLANYMVDAEIPVKAAAWVRAHIESPLMFLLALNLFLLVVGCVMDIFSAIVVVVPLLLPMAAAYNIHPLHLAMIFLANLELGYLTPPVGMNLFLASYRFERPVMEICRASLPFLAVLTAVVLLVTYVPGLSTGLAVR